MSYKLPETVYSWIWRGRHLAQADEPRSDGGIILPNHHADDRDAMVHFSRLLNSGVELSWLWLFVESQEAVALQMAAEYCITPETDMINQTLPKMPPGQSQLCSIAPLPLSWLKDAVPDDIHEVWVGFHWRRFANDRILRSATDAVVDVKGFRAIAAR